MGKLSVLRDAEYRHLSSQYPWPIPPHPDPTSPLNFMTSPLNFMKFRPTVWPPIISYRRTAVVPP